MDSLKLNGYQFKNPDLYEVALTHRSFANESKKWVVNNERLELLGDAVLDLVLVAELMRIFPEDDEGSLTQKRAYLVRTESLTLRATELEMSESIKLGKGEIASDGRQNPRLLASAFEAVVGAIYFDGGYEATQEFILTTFKEVLEQLQTETIETEDDKSKFQIHIQKEKKVAPVYKLISEEGPAHLRQFKVGVYVGEEQFGEGEGKTKKIAEQEAAKMALTKVEIQKVEKQKLESKE